jgi:hypothetical protein
MKKKVKPRLISQNLSRFLVTLKMQEQVKNQDGRVRMIPLLSRSGDPV